MNRVSFAVTKEHIAQMYAHINTLRPYQDLTRDTQTRRWQAIVSDKISTTDVWSLLMRRLLSVRAGGRKSGCGFYQIFMLLIAALCGATREHRKRRNQSSNC